jgi:succinate dehydrogenase / fumarate reductase, cytochrome b subunit
MTLPQVLFLLGLSLVLLTTLAFAVVIAVDAARTGSSAYLSGELLVRLWRSPAERAELDRWAFYAHRWTGFAIFAFLLLHILDVSVFAVSPERYDEIHELYGSAPLRVFESGLLFAILFHAFNGLRVLGIDLANLHATTARRLLGVVVVLTVVLGVAGSAVILAPVLP